MIELVERNIELPKDLPTIVGVDGALVNSGICVINKGKVFTAPLGTKLKGAERLSHIKTVFHYVLDQYKPQYASIEGYAYSGYGKVFDLAEAGGIFRLSLYERNIPTVEVPPKTMKKYITGNGGADKKQILKCLQKLFGYEFLMKENDEAESFAFAICGLDYFNNQISEVESFRDYLHSTCKQIVGEPKLRQENTKLLPSKVTPKQLKELTKLREDLNV